MLKQEMVEKIRRTKLEREADANKYYLELIDSINQATEEYVIAQNGFAETANQDLVDFYIYKMKSVEAKYRYLMKEYQRIRSVVTAQAYAVTPSGQLQNLKI